MVNKISRAVGQNIPHFSARVLAALYNGNIYFSLDDGKLLVSNWNVLHKRLAEKLPDWLRPLHNHGLLARIDDDEQVVEVTASSIVDDQLLAKLKTLPKLKKLYIEASKPVTEGGFAHVGEMAALESLEVYSITVPNDALRHLARLSSLRELTINNARIGDAGVEHLKGLSQLRVLRLEGNSITDAGLAHLKELTNLEVLDIAQSNWENSRMQISDAGLATVARFTRLRELDIGRLPITDEGFAKLAGLRELRQLRLAGTRITGDGLRALANFQNLESLSLGGPSFDDAAMQHVAKCPHLKHLSLRYTSVGDDGFRRIGWLGRLERLSLDSRFVTDAGLAHLSSLKNLKHIELRATRVTDKSLEHISKIASLTRLDLSGSGEPGVHIGRIFTAVGYAHLAKMSNLQTLWIDNADVSWTELRGLKQLKSLALFMPTMSADGVRRLQKELPDTHVSASSGGGFILQPTFEKVLE